MRILYGIALAAILTSCVGTEHRENGETDKVGRIQRREEVRGGKVRGVEVIKFLKDTNDPLEVRFFGLSVANEVLCHEKKFHYANGVVNKVDYFIYLDDKKIRAGQVLYETMDFKPVKFEYYSIDSPSQKVMNLSGLDMYTYANGKGLDSRRIIEYAYDSKTGTRMQLSQYVIKYDRNRAVSIRSSILDRESSNIIIKDEDNARVIKQILKNIEKSLQERSQGIRFLGVPCQ